MTRQFLVKRLFHNSRFQYQFYTRTTINPTNFQLKIPSHINPQAVLVLSTPSNLPQVIQNSIDLYQNNDLQLVIAGVDSVVPNSQRNGVSEMWMTNTMDITSAIPLEARDDLNTPPKESDGVHIVTARKNWKNIDSNLKLHLNQTMNIDLKLANTVFSTGSILTMYYFQPKALKDSTGNSGQHLCELDVRLPEGVISENAKVLVEDNWTPLYPEDRSFKITKCIGNLLKTVDTNPAAHYLEKNDRLMSIGSKETEVYVKIQKPNSNAIERYKVTAGGGGWGAKANTIVLSPEAKLVTGSSIQFFMVTPEDRYQVKNDEIENYQNAITLQSTYEEKSYNENTKPEQVFENVFGCGAEAGFFFNGIKHNSAGEYIRISL